MARTLLLLALALIVTACGPRGRMEYAIADPQATQLDIWAVRFRPQSHALAGQRSPPRPEHAVFERNRVSIPPGHQTGQIEWPDGTPAAGEAFVTLSTHIYPTMESFAGHVARDDTGNTGETILFVHGYNTRHGEAVYQMAQVAHDFEIPSPPVLFSWPSAGLATGYLYDRDSVLIARDQLEAVIRALTATSGRRLVILGHSLGNFLIMETLRQMEIAGDFDMRAKIPALIMVSPDIDGELFHAQASRLKQLPRPTVILAARQDRALRLSGLLTGGTNRLGSQTDRSAVRDLPVTVIDATELGGTGANHDIPLTSPAAIAILKKLDRKVLPGNVSLPPLIDLQGLITASGEILTTLP